MNTITTSIRVELCDVSVDEDRLIHTRLIRPQQAAKRTAYNRLREGWNDKQIWDLLRQQFELMTGRNLNDAILLAKGILASQKELLPEYLARKRRYRARLQEKLMQMQAPEPQRERIQAVQKRIETLTDECRQLQQHLDAGTVPPVVFGGRWLWQHVNRQLPGARSAWRHRRAAEYFSRGARNYKGNPHIRVVEQGGDLYLRLRVPNEIVKRGQTTTTKALWLTFLINYSYGYDGLLRNAARQGAAGEAQYTVRLLRLEPGKYRAFITVEEPVAQRTYHRWEALPKVDLIGGVDLNLDHIAVVVSDAQGQFRKWEIFRFPNLGELPRKKSKHRIGNLARDVVAWLQVHKVQALIIEDLNIQRRDENTTTMNRRTVPFAYRQLAEAISRRAGRHGLAVKCVNPAYTSWIGQLKYARMLGISTHVAAAYVIARRGLGFQERLPKSLICHFPMLITLLQTSAGLLQQQDGGDEKQLEKLSTWEQRLLNWKAYSPENERPWLLWVTLYGISKSISGARDVILS